MIDVESLIDDLPDPEAARRFINSFDEQQGPAALKLRRNIGLLSDVLTLAAYSPLLSTTILQNPEYLSWLARERTRAGVRSKDELLESLARFALTHSQVDLHTQLARFRRRELLRIFLSDIRRLTTIAEITEDISNLADAILETALRDARQEMDNRFGPPQVIDDNGKRSAAEFCIVSLGKLGSRELNYASDIDLLFLYSADGETSGRGSRGVVTNREYFVKLGEAVAQIVGKQTGEGAAYRVDMRLRPYGRVSPLSISVADAARYYGNEARDWERQVLIRSRASAGDAEVYKSFFEQVEANVFVALRDVHVQAALENVRLSKQMIDRELRPERGFNVKLGAGGVREIEFIAQALQLAYGGADRWLRAPHTLISLSRLGDRQLITESELTELFSAYEFLRHTEHILQMENGLQTHTVPEDKHRRALVSKRMGFEAVGAFDAELARNSENVHRIFGRVFEKSFSPSEGGMPLRPRSVSLPEGESGPEPAGSELTHNEQPRHRQPLIPLLGEQRSSLSDYYRNQLAESIEAESDFRHRLGSFRRRWSDLLDEIKTADTKCEIDIRQAKRAQTALAEASVDVALNITRGVLEKKYKTRLETLPLAVMGLGKLGGGAIDYESDLDLVLVYDDSRPIPCAASLPEFYSRVAEIFVTTLSSMTRDGSIYRVDLRLRPYGKNGTSTIAASVFADYMRDSANIWEWLAYVKLRAVAGDIDLATSVEDDVRAIIYERAAIADPSELANETRRMRLLLEKEKTGRRSGKEIDIKYGAGGMLDVYFAMRFLQLRDDVPESPDDRSTRSMLEVLRDNGSLSREQHATIFAGYDFLSTLDHTLRLTIGRTTRLPVANVRALDAVAGRMQLNDHRELIQLLSVHRLNTRAAFDEIVK